MKKFENFILIVILPKFNIEILFKININSRIDGKNNFHRIPWNSIIRANDGNIQYFHFRILISYYTKCFGIENAQFILFN